MALLNKKRTLIGSVIALLILGCFVIVALWNTKRQTEAVDSVTSGPMFHFDKSKAPGWWSDGNVVQNASDFTGGQVTKDNLASSLITINQGERGKSSDCFVTYYYWDKPVDPSVALAKMEKQSVGESSSVVLVPLRTQMATIDTNVGKKELQIHQYEFTGSGSATRAKGVQFGYISLDKGHIEMRGYCNKADQLIDTVSALQSIVFKS